jgi:membrane fusion protein, multidrug efflux system
MITPALPHRPAFWASWHIPLLVLLSLGLVACSDSAGLPTEARVDAGMPVAALEVQPRDLSRRLSLSATVQPRVTVRLASRAQGTLQVVLVEEGDPVREGEHLAQLDMSEAAAELDRASAQEEEAQLGYRRVADLRGSGVASIAEYERARAALRIAQSERGLWETRLSFGRISAPLDGVVTARHVEPGEAVSAYATLFELAAMDELVLRLGVSELDVVHLQVGQPVPVRLDALPGLKLTGTIRRIFPMADRASRLVTVEVALPPDAAEHGVRPGFLGRVVTAVDARPQALAVPAAAVGENGDIRYVLVIEGDQLSYREIEPGVTRGQWTEVVSGLEPGEIVLATNPIDMREGQRVRIVGWRG